MKINLIDMVKENRIIAILSAYGLVDLIVILIATLAMREFVVPVCVLVIIETAIAALLRKSELWLHGAVVIVQIVAGLLIRRFPLILLCVLIYVAATVALMFMYKDETQ